MTALIDGAVPDAGTVRLRELDAKGGAVEPALCVLADDGATGGDLVAGNGVYTCSAAVTRAAPGTVDLAIEALVGGTRFVSPGATLRDGAIRAHRTGVPT